MANTLHECRRIGEGMWVEETCPRNLQSFPVNFSTDLVEGTKGRLLMMSPDCVGCWDS